MSKVTREIIDSRISRVSYSIIPDTTITTCLITMVNGYDVLGFSACVDPKEFDSALGQKYAYEDAYEKIWPLEGYLLQENLSKVNSETMMDIGAARQSLLAGEKVSRSGWNGKGMYLMWVDPTQWGVSPALQAACSDASGGRYGFIMMKTADGKMVPWLCSQADLMASDYVIYQAPEVEGE